MSEDEFVFGGDATDIPPGTYPGKLAALGRKTSDAFGDFRTWDFTLDTGSVVGGASSMNTGPKSKGGRWAAALNGGVQYKGTSTELIGKPCLIVVGLDKNDWPVVTDVLPPMKGNAGIPAVTSHLKPSPKIVDQEQPERTDDDALPF